MKIAIGIIGCLLFVGFITFTDARSPQTGHSLRPKNVLQYFHLLPSRYFECEPKNRDEHIRRMLDSSRGSIIDIPNGYIFAGGDAAQDDLQVCLFKQTDGSFLVGVAATGEADEFDWHQPLVFFRLEGGRLRPVTKSVMPFRVQKQVQYKMPRQGTTIRVQTEEGKRLYDLAWNGTKFEKRQPEP